VTTPAAPDQADEACALMSADTLAAIRQRALACDDKDRQRRGKWPRPTRCRQCATILTLLAHIEIITCSRVRDV
jgi:hypothetical protein